MAKITHHKNQFNKDEFDLLDSKKTIKEVLEANNLDDKPLCIVLNGKVPDEIDLEYEIKENDDLKILNFFEGGGRGGEGKQKKNFLETVYDIATISAVFIPGVGPFVAMGMSLSRGFLFKKKTPTSSSSSGNEVKQASPYKAVNEARPNEEISLNFGKIRVSPDSYTPTIEYIDFPQPPLTVGGGTLIGSNPPIIITTLNTNMMPKDTVISVQSYCFGFGDLNISDRKVYLSQSDYNLINSGSSLDEDYWGYNTSFGFKGQNEFDFGFYGRKDRVIFPSQRLYTNLIKSPTSISVLQDAKLTNTDAYSTQIPLNDHEDRNWVVFTGAPGQNFFECRVEGLLNWLSSTGAITYIELQIKLLTDVDWRARRNYHLEGNYARTSSQEILWGLDPMPDDAILQIRIRKMIPDSFRINDGIVSSLVIKSPHFYREQVSGDQEGRSKFPLNIEATAVRSNVLSEDQSTSKYSAIIEAKCFVFNFSSNNWEWTTTENPAWWFLYFAKGGFLALESRSSDPLNVFPLSPTNFWQNSVESSQGTELMWGCGIRSDEIDLDKIKEWAIFCDENSLQCNMTHQKNETAYDTLERIANLGRGSISYINGLLSVSYEDSNQIPVTMFGNANILADSFSVSYGSNGGVGKIELTFFDEDNDYSEGKVSANVPYFPLDTRKTVQKIALEGVTNKDLAQRECNLLAARQFFQKRVYSWRSDHEGFLARRGDLVYLSSDATQYGYSGRVVSFLFNEDGSVRGIKGSSIIDTECEWCLVKLPNSEMVKLRCEIINDEIIFLDEFNLEDAPFYVREERRNQINKFSRFPTTTPDDYTYIADIKETTGKIVRISSVEVDENNNFSYSAVDEDPAMWAFENGATIDPESFDDAIGIIEVFDYSVEYLSGDKVKIMFNASDDCLFMIIDDATESPIDINGRFSFSEKEVIIESEREVERNLRIVPVRVYEKVQSRSLEVVLWPA